jgi:hypothetical protein
MPLASMHFCVGLDFVTPSLIFYVCMYLCICLSIYRYVHICIFTYEYIPMYMYIYSYRRFHGVSQQLLYSYNLLSKHLHQ